RIAGVRAGFRVCASRMEEAKQADVLGRRAGGGLGFRAVSLHYSHRVIRSPDRTAVVNVGRRERLRIALARFGVKAVARPTRSNAMTSRNFIQSVFRPYLVS